MARRTLVFASAFLVAGILILVGASVALGSHPGTNVLGWVWGGSTDNTLGPPGCAASATCPPTLENTTGVGWISLHNNGGAGIGSYGLQIPATVSANPTLNNVTGYAWSSNLGWIDFQPIGPYPAAPNHSVRRVSGTPNDRLFGWARLVSIQNALAAPVFAPGVSSPSNSGGWKGWIKFGQGSNYTGPINNGVDRNGVELIPGSPDSPIEGYAWSNEVGWFKFGGLTPGLDNPIVIGPTSPSATISALPNPVQSGSPTTLSWSAANVTSCSITPAGAPGVSWNPVPLPGTGQTNPLTSAQTFTINCTGPNGPASNSVVVNVTSSPLIPSATISASPNPVTSGNPTTLSWSAANVTSCSITPAGAPGVSWNPVPLPGSGPTNPLTAQQTFTISCSGPNGPASNSVLVDITGGSTIITPPVNCFPSVQSVPLGQIANFSATGGGPNNGAPPSPGNPKTYSWSAPPGSSNLTGGPGPNFSTIFLAGSSGIKIVTVTSPALPAPGVTTSTDSCEVSVLGEIPPP